MSDSEGVERHVSLAILGTAKVAQGAHGLKHGDFVRYRQYCSRRLMRVRRVTKLQQGRGRFVARAVSAADAVRDERALLIPLFDAERAWAAAMEIKRISRAASSAIKLEGDGAVRRKVMAKLKRACQAAERLRTICDEIADKQTGLEAEAYAKWMNATFSLEREEWAKALNDFEIVERIYTSMIAMCGGTAAAGVFEERNDEVATAVRFCKYNLARTGQGVDDEQELLRGMRDAASGGDDMLLQRIDTVLGEARRKAAQDMQEVKWCGVSIPLRSEKVREAVLLASEQSRALRQDKEKKESVDAYDSVFIAYNDAIVTVNRQLREFRDASSSRADEKIAELDHLVAYLTHGRINHTVERNLLLVQSFKDKASSKPEDFVRLFDNLIQNMSDILGLPGIENDACMSNAAEARRTVFRVCRCFYLAECYRISNSVPEALALYDHVSVLAKTIPPNYTDQTADVVQQSRGSKCRLQAYEVLKQIGVTDDFSALSMGGGKTESSQTRMLMLDHLDEFIPFAGKSAQNRSIIDIPPPLEAIPCKPVSFDLALDGVQPPELHVESKMQDKKAETSSENEQPGATARSYFSRWWSAKS